MVPCAWKLIAIRGILRGSRGKRRELRLTEKKTTLLWDKLMLHQRKCNIPPKHQRTNWNRTYLHGKRHPGLSCSWTAVFRGYFQSNAFFTHNTRLWTHIYPLSHTHGAQNTKMAPYHNEHKINNDSLLGLHANNLSRQSTQVSSSSVSTKWVQVSQTASPQKQLALRSTVWWIWSPTVWSLVKSKAESFPRVAFRKK